VTTDGGGAIPYIMTNEVTGLIVDRDDHHALAAAAMRLLDNSELALRLSRNAYESSKRFNWSHIRDQWLNLYRELAKEKGLLLNTSEGRVPFAETDSAV
jgi:glycosyltransferase involved in cell wall biosynthesis